jgi:CubicO group peptidase (beta-lactamase class C family)/chromosome segregation ATPase
MNHALAELVEYQFYIISVQCVRWLRSVAILCLIFTSLSLVLSGQSMAQSDWSEPVSQWRGHWYVATPSVLGFDPLQLSSTIDSIGEMQGVYGFLLIRNGYLVAEQYWREGDVTKAHNMKSASKSVISSLVGIAIERGHFKLDQPIIDLLPQSKLLLDVPDKKQITVRHLLTMRSGLEPTSYQSYNSWVASSDWIEEALKAPLLSVPGTTYHYSTANSHLLSAILAGNTGMSTRAFAEKELFNPMGVTISGWETDPNGIHVGGNNLSILPRDMAKFGQLYLDHGRWQEHQLIPKWWVDASTAVSDNGEHQTYGNYGFLWWSEPLDQGSFAAVGYGGQYVVVSPEHNTVMVVISELESKGDLWETKLFDLLNYGVLGSLIDPSMPPKVIAAVTTTKVNLRSIPSKQGEVLRTISAGTKVLLSKRDTEWVFGRVEQHSGWLHAQFIDQLELASAMASTVVVASEPKDSLLQLLKEKQSLEIELSDSRKQVISFENQLALVQTKYRKSKDEFISLSEASEGKSRQMIKLKQKLGIAENRQLRVEEAFAGFNAKIVGLNQALTELESVNRKKILKLEAKDQQFEQLKTQYVEKQTEFEKLRLENGSRGQLISDYETEKAEVAARYGDLVATAETSQQDVTRLKAELLQVESDRQLTQNELAESQKQAGNFEKAVAAAQQSKKLISAELALSEEQLNISSASLAELRSAEQLVVTRYNKIHVELDDVKQSFVALQTDKQQLAYKLIENKARIANLNQTLDDELVTKQLIADELTVATTQITHLENILNENQVNLQSLITERDIRWAKIVALEKIRADEQAENQSISNKMQVGRKHIASLEESLDQTHGDLQIVVSKLETSQTQVGILEQSFEKLRASNQLTAIEQLSNQKQMGSLKNELSQAKLENQFVSSTLEASNRVNVILEEMLVKLKLDMKFRVSELAASRTWGEKIQKSLTAVWDQQQLDTAALNDGEKKIENLKKDLAQTRVEKSQVTTRLATNEASIRHFEASLASAELEKNNLNEKLEASQTRADKLEKSLTQSQNAHKMDASILIGLRGNQQNQSVQIETLNADLLRKQTENNSLLIEYADRQGKISNFKDKLALLQSDNQASESMLVASYNEISELEKLLDNYKGGVAELINLLGQSAANVSNASIQRVLNDAGVVLLIDQLMPINVPEEPQPLALSGLNGGSADDLHLAEIETFVRDWAQSWSQKNVSNYFAFYGSNFRPGDGLNYEQWKQLRRKRLSQPKFIEVSISDLKVTKLVSGNLKVTFGQGYRTESYRDQIVKTIEMVQNNSGWKIISEESL